MARLPNPGSDDGLWGEILNDYLSQSIAADGSLKPNSVKTTSIADGTVTNAKLDSIVQATLTNSRTPTSHKNTHTSNGSDPLTPEDIGAATMAQGEKADSAVQPSTLTSYVAKTGDTMTGTLSIGATPDAIARLHIETDGPGNINLVRNSTGVLGASLVLQKARGTNAARTIVNNGDHMGGIVSGGWDGSAFSQATTISAFVDGAPASGSVPGKLHFMTTPANGTAPVIKMVIKSDGNVGVGTNFSTPTAKLHVIGSSITEPTSIYRSASSQTADITQWQNSAGTPLAKITSDGDIELTNSTKGVILNSPDGTRYRLTVMDGGTLSINTV